MFAAIAPRYDLNNRLHSGFQDRRWRRVAVELAAIRPGDRVLDVACGTGDLAEAFVEGGAAAVLGVDFTAEMLERARRKALRFDSARRPEYRLGDALHLEFPGASFDVVSIAFGIRNVSDPRRALEEFHRVLRPGGRLVVLEFSQPRSRVLRALNRVYTEHLMPVTAGLLARDRVGAYRYLPRSVATFADHRALAGMIEAVGFEGIAQRSLAFGVCVATVARRAAERTPPEGRGGADRDPAAGGA